MVEGNYFSCCFLFHWFVNIIELYPLARQFCACGAGGTDMGETRESKRVGRGGVCAYSYVCMKSSSCQHLLPKILQSAVLKPSDFSKLLVSWPGFIWINSPCIRNQIRISLIKIGWQCFCNLTEVTETLWVLSTTVWWRTRLQNCDFKQVMQKESSDAICYLCQTLAEKNLFLK